jgi:DNA-directed RNA polymerase III subunit RPC3
MVRANAPGDGSDSEDFEGFNSGAGTVARSVEGDGSSDTLNSSDEDDDDDDEIQPTIRSKPRANGRVTKVKFEEEAPSAGKRIDQMRQHLLLLAESRQGFLRHCGNQAGGQWTVDFSKVMGNVRESELDAVIEQSFGRHGLRLTRILRDRGKLDEKMLPAAAMMKKPEVQGKMLAMQMAGLVDVQEVPKDGSRLANRTFFFWFFDGERTQAQLLDDIYKAMLRCLQTLDVERHKERHVLTFVERKDVEGREEEVMTAEHYNQYNAHLDVQSKLLAQVSRLDDMIAVFRDY